MVQILHVRASEGATDESQITEVRWYNPQTGAINVATAAAMVHFIATDKGKAYIYDGTRAAIVEVTGGPSGLYIHVAVPGKPDINLLSLPRF